MIYWLEQVSATKNTRSRLNSACRSKVRRPLEKGSTGMIRAEPDDRLVGAMPDNQGRWSKAQQGRSKQCSLIA